jgi:hypothetical protein
LVEQINLIDSTDAGHTVHAGDAAVLDQYTEIDLGKKDSGSVSVDSTSTVGANSRPPTPQEVTKSGERCELDIDSLDTDIEVTQLDLSPLNAQLQQGSPLCQDSCRLY